MTATTLTCAPTELVPVSITACTATVKDEASNPSDPTGDVTFSSDNPDQIFSSESCKLEKTPSGEFTCSVAYRPLGAGIHNITAKYAGDAGHKPSSSVPVELAVTPSEECDLEEPPSPPAEPPPPGEEGGGEEPPAPPVDPLLPPSEDGGDGLTNVAFSTGNGTVGTSAIDGGGDGGGGGGGGGDPKPQVTSTTLICAPTQLAANSSTTCTARVKVDAVIATDPTGNVAFSSDNPTHLFSSESCKLEKTPSDEFTCSVAYRPLGAGIHNITAKYAGDAGHKPSSSVPVELTVMPPQGEDCGGEVPPPPPPPPASEGGDDKPPLPLPAEKLPPVPSIPPAPNTMLKKRPPRKGVVRQARFAFAADQAGSTFQCRLDREPFKPCSSPLARSVKPGHHALSVRAVNSAGIVDPTPAVVRWEVIRVADRRSG